MKKYLSAFVSGFGAGVLSIVPVAKTFTCCLIVPAAAYISLVLDQKATKDFSKISIKKGVIFGLLTGLYAALFGSSFDLIVTFITKNNDIVATFPELQKIITDFPISEQLQTEVLNLLGGVVEEIKSKGFSLIYSITILTNNLVLNSLFGMLGGVLSVQIINSRIKSPPADTQ